MARACITILRSALVYVAAYGFCSCLWHVIQGSYACVPMFSTFVAAYVALYEIRSY